MISHPPPLPPSQLACQLGLQQGLSKRTLRAFKFVIWIQPCPSYLYDTMTQLRALLEVEWPRQGCRVSPQHGRGVHSMIFIITLQVEGIEEPSSADWINLVILNPERCPYGTLCSFSRIINSQGLWNPEASLWTPLFWGLFILHNAWFKNVPFPWMLP